MDFELKLFLLGASFINNDGFYFVVWVHWIQPAKVCDCSFYKEFMETNKTDFFCYKLNEINWNWIQFKG